MPHSQTTSFSPARVEAAAQPTPAPSGDPAASTILLVDDDAAVRESVGRVLASEGWRVVTAADGAGALAYLAILPPDLLITDLNMADVNGWDLLFHESIQRPDLPIFVISGLPPSSRGGADAFAAEFFAKPLDLEALVLAVRRRLGRNSSMPGAAP